MFIYVYPNIAWSLCDCPSVNDPTESNVLCVMLLTGVMGLVKELPQETWHKSTEQILAT